MAPRAPEADSNPGQAATDTAEPRDRTAGRTLVPDTDQLADSRRGRRRYVEAIGRLAAVAALAGAVVLLGCGEEDSPSVDAQADCFEEVAVDVTGYEPEANTPPWAEQETAPWRAELDEGGGWRTAEPDWEDAAVEYEECLAAD